MPPSTGLGLLKRDELMEGSAVAESAQQEASAATAALIVVGLTLAALLIAGLYYLLRYNHTVREFLSRSNITSMIMFWRRPEWGFASDNSEKPRQAGPTSGMRGGAHRGGDRNMSPSNNMKRIKNSHVVNGDQFRPDVNSSAISTTGANRRGHHTGQTTLWSDDTPQEIAIPIFMVARPGKDFEVVDKDTPLTRGGSASIFKVKILQLDIKKRMLKPGSKKSLSAIKSDDDIDDENDLELACVKVWPRSTSGHGGSDSDSDLDRDPDLAAAFQQELGIMWRFRETPNFAQLYAYSDEPQMSIVMKYYSGQSLKHYIRSHFENYSDTPIPQPILFHILIPLCKAIKLMHQSGIVHCDLKPANILLEWVMPVAPSSPASQNNGKNTSPNPNGAPHHGKKAKLDRNLDAEPISNISMMMDSMVYGYDDHDRVAHQMLPIPVPYITDFGISKVLDKASSLRVKAFKVANVNGASLPYSAPEVFKALRRQMMLFAEGRNEDTEDFDTEMEPYAANAMESNYAAHGSTVEEIDESSRRFMGRDLYALACVMYEMMVGKTPWSLVVSSNSHQNSTG